MEQHSLTLVDFEIRPLYEFHSVLWTKLTESVMQRAKRSIEGKLSIVQTGRPRTNVSQVVAFVGPVRD